MELQLPTAELHRYKSASQQARVSTEPWAQANLYCPVCESERIESLRANTPAHDFKCPICSAAFQLKSKASKFGRKVQDGAYSTMKETILGDRTPNLFLLQYERPSFLIKGITLIPHFAFTISALERRNPLSAKAERHDWVGCNFLLDRIPPDAKIPVVDVGKPVPPAEVRKAYKRVRPLEKLNIEKRGWTLDVLNVVRSLGKNEFSLHDVYARTAALAALHSGNRNVQPKIRQQLQQLRDLGFLTFDSPGHYTLL